MVFNLSENNSIANHFLVELRDLETQKDRGKFRNNLEKLGEVLAYEVSKTLEYEKKPLVTPMAITSVSQLVSQPVLAVILRAGVPFFQGFLNFFDQADCAFIGAYRKDHNADYTFDIRKDHNADYTFDISMEYVATPTLEGRTLIIIDPMLATGKSILSSYATLLEFGKPLQLYVASAIAAPEGIDLLEREIPDVSIWTGAIDEKLNSKFYILPGLGDAGDLAFGSKI
jgi:uracil phosphoribosyltransferase